MSNEAAERLRTLLAAAAMPESVLDAALAAERKATVERIRLALDTASKGGYVGPLVYAILDAEAAR